MIAAIYARKSTDQNGVGDEEKSVNRQIEHAKAYATRKGWAVADEYIYDDDGISGAEFTKRPGFLRLMNALKPKLSFAKTPTGGQVVDRSALIRPRSNRSGRRSPCLHGVDPRDNSTVLGRSRFPSCSPAKGSRGSGSDRGTCRASLESDASGLRPLRAPPRAAWASTPQ